MSSLFAREPVESRQLYDHQNDGMERLRECYRQGFRRPVLQAPTGYGKTVVATAITRGALNKGRKLIFTVPRIDLIDQTVEQFAADGIHDVGVMQARHHLTDYSQPVQIASVQTLAKRGAPDAGLVLVDECHIAFEAVHEWMAQYPDIPFIGLSATPWTKGLGKHFDALVVASTTQELIDKGFLSPFKVFAPAHPDLRGVRTKMGDYAEGDLEKAMNKAKLVGDIVDTWLRKGEGRPTLVFAVNRAHAMHLKERFEYSGVACGYQDANTTADDRRENRRKFHNGEYPVVVNIGTLTTGVDWDVRCIVLARPTKSEILFTQIIGRGLRTAPGKDYCLILDHSDTTLRLGFVTDILHDTLDDGKERPKSERAAPLPKECPKCSFLRPANVTVCPACGHRPVTVAKDVRTANGVLAELSDSGLTRQGGTKKVSRTHIEMGAGVMPLADFCRMLRGYGEAHGYRPGWASQKFKFAVGKWPERVWENYPPMDPSPSVHSWIRAQNIRYARGVGR